MTLLSLAISAGAIYLCNETWWIRHVGDDFTPSPHLASPLYKMAWKVAVHTLVAVIIISLVLRYLLKIRDAWNVTFNALKPLGIGGVIAFVCFLPVPELDAVARMILPVVTFCCAVRFIQYLNKSQITFMRLDIQPRRAGWVVFVAAFAIHLIPWWNVTTRELDGNRDYLLTGDQPAYLYMADSLVMDRDLDVSNNFLPKGVYHRDDGRHAGGVERHNRDVRPGSPDYLAREKAFGDASYSTHRPGTSFLIAPLYFIGTQLGDYHRALSCLLLVLLTALALRELTLAATILTGQPWGALLMGLALAVSVPVAVMSVAIFPETIMFYVLSRMIRLTTEHKLGWRHSIEMGIWLSLAPWLQDKYLLWVLPFIIVRLVFLWPRWRTIVISAMPVVLSALAMIQFNLLLFGQMLPKNSLGRFLTFRESIMSGLPGTWFDWGFGLMVLAPFSLLSLAGILLWWREGKQNTVSLATLAASLATLVAGKWIIGTWWCWWGGFAPPNRFMFTLLPLTALFAMIATIHARGTLRALAVVIWMVSAALGIDALFHPELWYTSDFPSATIAAALGLDNFAARFPPLFPGVYESNSRGLFMTAAGMIALLGLAWQTQRYGAPIRDRIVVPLLLLTLLMAGLPAANVTAPVIGSRDIPTRVGVLIEPVLQPEANGAYALETDFFYRKLHGPLALGIHFLNDRGRVISQADFDLNDYRNEWIHAADENRQRWATDHTIHVRRTLHPPQGTTSVRIQLYNPALATTYGSQKRGKPDFIALP